MPLPFFTNNRPLPSTLSTEGWSVLWASLAIIDRRKLRRCNTTIYLVFRLSETSSDYSTVLRKKQPKMTGQHPNWLEKKINWFSFLKWNETRRAITLMWSVAYLALTVSELKNFASEVLFSETRKIWQGRSLTEFEIQIKAPLLPIFQPLMHPAKKFSFQSQKASSLSCPKST